MNILLVAPEIPNVDSVPEIRVLGGQHRVLVLSGKVAVQDVYQEARRLNYDAIHFATHGSPDGVKLGVMETITPDGTIQRREEWLTEVDILQISKLSKARLVFFNACNTSKLASYLVGHGILYAISATTTIEDNDAWKFPLAFYEHITQQPSREHDMINYALAFEKTSDGTGLYSFYVNVQEYLSRPTEVEFKELVNHVGQLQTDLKLVGQSLTETKRSLRVVIGAYTTLICVIVLFILAQTFGAF